MKRIKKLYKQRIKVDGEVYYYQETFYDKMDLHYHIKRNPRYTYRKTTCFDGERIPDPPRTLGMRLCGKRHPPLYEIVLYATNPGCYQQHAI